MLAAASSLFGRTAISQNYYIGTQAPVASPGSSTGGGSSALPASALAPPFSVGPWKVQQATHKVTNKRVSVWSCEKRSPEMEKIGAQGKERVLEVLKLEASSLGRLRHPSILEMVESLEETRSEITFATEPLLSSLLLAIPDGSKSAPFVELDEIEIQKGVLQLAKGLSFLHTSAKLVHSNITPWTVLINASGDWKISGLGLTIPITGADGKPTQWEFPSFDTRLPSHIQRNFDYMAPEYAIDELLSTSSDVYALGCVIYAVHNKGSPPFRNHGSLSTFRSNVSDGLRLPPNERWDPDLRSLLSSLITRNPQSRISSTSLPTHAFFSSLSISTLNFLERSTFASKPREEKIAFMKGLTGVLDRFSAGLRIRKLLPSLLEEMKDPHLLPSILPNIFVISNTLTSTQFASLVLPSLKPLFSIKEPPQNMVTLLENLKLLQDKTDSAVFREHVLPLVYNALESEQAAVQEKALMVIPDLCETIDYAEVQGVLFPRVATLFKHTRILSVKVNTLVCFLSMVKTLDQSNLTQKLVPLLSQIKTKEPAVMLATLSVHEAMGLKVDREAVATLVLPQLWQMSIGPLLNVDQFARFMMVIRGLSERVEKEHSQYLRDSQRIEDRSGPAGAVLNGTSAFVSTINRGVNFESLVAGGGGGVAVTQNSNFSGSPAANGSGTQWEDDVWGSLLGPESPPIQPTPLKHSTTSTAPPPQSRSLPGTPQPALRPLAPTTRTSSTAYKSFTASIPPPPSAPRSSATTSSLAPRSIPSASTFPSTPSSPTQAQRPTYGSGLGLGLGAGVMQPTMSGSTSPTPMSGNSFMGSSGSAFGGSSSMGLPPLMPTSSSMTPLQPTSSGLQPSRPAFMGQQSMASMAPMGQSPMAAMMGGGILAPSRPATTQKPKVMDLGDFDPLS